MSIIHSEQGRYQSIIVVLTMLICLFILSACSLPPNPREIFPQPLIINEQSQLAQRILPDNKKHQGKTGVFVLYDGEDAFTARLALIKKAEQTIDAQYYIWHDDISGRLLLKELYQAGERGVKVRLLLDDNGTVGLDEMLLRLNAHPNISVKLFNPYLQRKFRSFAYFTDTIRINRRMHNKSLTVDGLISIIGGRNIGDEYFSVKKDLVFADLDVSLVGKVVPNIEHDFNRYWVSRSSYPLEKIVKYKTDNQQPIKIRKPKKTKDYLMRLFDVKYFNYINTPNAPLLWTEVEYLSDPPSKAMQGRKFQFDDSLLAKLFPLVASTEEQLILISPYFVPTKAGTDYLVNMVKRGKRVVIITNSLSATDVTIVHSGYEKYRKKLLAGGVELYEFKDDPQNDEYGKKNS
ncbi:MAG: phospholipase D family protein [Moraxellaceae bacterium]|nr:phospholipase D family protein [Moraxellaceae bacterium]